MVDMPQEWTAYPPDSDSGNWEIEDEYGHTATVYGEGELAKSIAMLIAAAPELLAALKKAYDALDYAQAQVDSDTDRWHLTRCRRKLKPVIDRAEGRP